MIEVWDYSDDYYSVHLISYSVNTPFIVFSQFMAQNKHNIYKCITNTEGKAYRPFNWGIVSLFDVFLLWITKKQLITEKRKMGFNRKGFVTKSLTGQTSSWATVCTGIKAFLLWNKWFWRQLPPNVCLD